MYGCVSRELTPKMGAFLEGLYPYESLEMGSCEPVYIEASGLKSLTYGCH